MGPGIATVRLLAPLREYTIACTPAPVSVAARSTETSVLFQPAAFGPGNTLAVLAGSVLSILMSLIASGSLWLPALSVAVTVMPWPAPSCEKVKGAGQDATPDRSSVQLKV